VTLAALAAALTGPRRIEALSALAQANAGDPEVTRLLGDALAEASAGGSGDREPARQRRLARARGTPAARTARRQRRSDDRGCRRRSRGSATGPPSRRSPRRHAPATARPRTGVACADRDRRARGNRPRRAGGGEPGSRDRRRPRSRAPGAGRNARGSARAAASDREQHRRHRPPQAHCRRCAGPDAGDESLLVGLCRGRRRPRSGSWHCRAGRGRVTPPPRWRGDAPPRRRGRPTRAAMALGLRR